MHEKVCVKLVIYKDHTRMHGQQNIKYVWMYVRTHVCMYSIAKHSICCVPCACMITFKSHPHLEIQCNLISLWQTTELPSEADKSSPNGSLFVYLFLSNHQKIIIFINTAARTSYMFQWTAVTSRFKPHIEFYILELYGHEYNLEFV